MVLGVGLEEMEFRSEMTVQWKTPALRYPGPGCDPANVPLSGERQGEGENTGLVPVFDEAQMCLP